MNINVMPGKASGIGKVGVSVGKVWAQKTPDNEILVGDLPCEVVRFTGGNSEGYDHLRVRLSGAQLRELHQLLGEYLDNEAELDTPTVDY
jgi:hypothetical protein